MEYRDYYQVLGVSKDSTEKELKHAYRKLARKHHPDVNPGDLGAEHKFKELNEAYEVLSDQDKRSKYDRLGTNWKQYENYARAQPGGPGGGFRVDFESGGGMGGFSDFFKTFFGGGVDLDDLFGQAGSGFRGGRRGSGPGGARAQRGFGGDGQAPPARAGTDVSGELTITLDEAYHGTTKRLSIQGDSGVESIDVRIPPGVKAGSKIRVSGKGERLQGSSAGDLYLSVRMQGHPVYKTKDDDLYVDVPVTFSEATLGAEIEVPTLSGKSRVKVPAGSQAGRLLRLRGKGMPHLKGDGHGDLFAKLLIVVPKELSQRERELMKELSEIRGENPRAHLDCS